MAINWEMLGQPTNALASYVGGMEAGQKVKTDRTRRNALAAYGSDPEGSISALMGAGDIETANALRTYGRQERQDQARTTAMEAYGSGDIKGAQAAAVGAGDFDLAKSISEMDEAQRERTREMAEESAAVIASAARLPTPEARRAFIMQNGERLKGLGYSDEQLAGYDVTDPQKMFADAMQFTSVKDIIGQYNDDRDYSLDVDRFGETKRSNRANEGLRAQSNSTAAFSAQTGRMSFNERKASRGFGTPGAGGGFDASAIEWD